MSDSLSSSASCTIPGPAGMKFCHVPAGAFVMGSLVTEERRSANESLHQVILTQSYQMTNTLITQKCWEEVMGYNYSKFRKRGVEAPVEGVCYDESTRFCAQLTTADGEWGYQLPTEAQWEYACRAGTVGPYNVDALPLEDLGWYQQNSENSTHPVGLKHPNAWGLYDMHGNVAEWCADWYQSDLGTAVATDPSGPEKSNRNRERVIRGGGWDYMPERCRSAARGARPGGEQVEHLGFRVIRMRK